MNAQIANHLKIEESAILRVEQWATVLFVVVAGKGARFVSKKVIKMEPKYLILETYRSKGINAYLVPVGADGKALDCTQNMYGQPRPGQEDKAHKSKQHQVRVRIDNLPDGKYIYKECQPVNKHKSQYGWIVLKGGEIVEEG
jgi:hypothetical protein